MNIAKVLLALYLALACSVANAQTLQYVGVADTPTEAGCAGPQNVSAVGCLNNPPPGGHYNDAAIVVHGGLDMNTCLQKVQTAETITGFNPKMTTLDNAHSDLFNPPTSPGLSSFNGVCDYPGSLTYVGTPRQGHYTIIFQKLTYDECTLLLSWSVEASCGTRETQ